MARLRVRPQLRRRAVRRATTPARVRGAGARRAGRDRDAGGGMRGVAGRGAYQGLLGIALLIGAWYLTVDALALPRFTSLPGLGQVVGEWFSHHPTYGTSAFTHDYYVDIWVSLRRVLLAFGLSLGLGVPLGLALGWS